MCAGIQRFVGLWLGAKHGVDGENFPGRSHSGNAGRLVGLSGQPSHHRAQVRTVDDAGGLLNMMQ